jgi:tetratricopeptide (TPR) repeat protein
MAGGARGKTGVQKAEVEMYARNSASAGRAPRLRRPGGALVCLIGGLLVALSGPLGAAETVLFNQSAAHQCYLAALRGADAREVDICNAAIEHQSLARPDFAATLSNRGLLLSRSGNYEEALRDHARAIATAPDLAGLYINR